MPWHLSRVPVSFNQWTNEGGEESERKPLAFVHTAYISDLLDGNHPWRAAAGTWNDRHTWPGFPCLCTPRAHSTAISGRRDSVYLIRWRISLHPPESTLVALAGSGLSTCAKLAFALSILFPLHSGSTWVGDLLKRE